MTNRPPTDACNEPGHAAILLHQVYRQLRRLAFAYLESEGPYHTLQPTALVHEAYLRLARFERMRWRSDTHFFAVAAAQMRRVLVDHARARAASKRGAGATRVELREDTALHEDRTIEVLALDEALERLAERSVRQSRVAELRLFSGLTVKETAEFLGVSERTIKGDWRIARAWLSRELDDGRVA